jgi:hypothetical protein
MWIENGHVAVKAFRLVLPCANKSENVEHINELSVKGYYSAVGKATGYGLHESGVRAPVGSIIFASPQRPDQFSGPSSLLSNGYWALSKEAKRQGREADHTCRNEYQKQKNNVSGE